MKKIMLSALFVAFAATVTIAQPVETVNIEVIAQQEKNAIKLEELPDPVKATLSGEEYAAWTPSEAFVVIPAEGAKHFEVIFKKEEEVKVVSLGEDGKIIEAPAVEEVEAQ
jgi:hypothetical protein